MRHIATSVTKKALFLMLILTISIGALPAVAQPVTEPDTSLSQLVDVLKDDAARNKLISELEKVVATDPVENTAIVAPEQDMSLGRRVALFTQATVESSVARLKNVQASLSSSDNAFSGLSGNELNVLFGAIPSLLLVVAITIGIFVSLRVMAIPAYRRLGGRAQEANAFRTVLLFTATNLFDVVIVIAAWAIGYAVTVVAVGEFGTIGIRQSMYLNAFLLIEMAKVAVRAVLSPNTVGLRLVPLSDRAAKSLTKYISIVISVMGYGQLLVVPIVNQSTSFAAGSGVTALLSVFVLLYVCVITLKRRKEVSVWLVSNFDPKTLAVADQTEQTDGEITDTAQQELHENANRGGLRGFLMGLAQAWHWFALVYLAVMFIVVMTQSAETIFSALLGSGKVLLALIVASLVSGFLARSVASGVSLPNEITKKLPLLEPRINGFMSKAFWVVRLAVVAVVVFFIMDIIGLVDMQGWLESQIGLNLTSIVFSVAFILLATFAIWLAFTSWVDFRLNPEYGAVPTAREITLLTLFRNAATIALVVLTLMLCLSEIGLDIGPLLASAGVLGLAIGFGSQKMVQDIITGIFIQFENAINVGDIITVGGTTGGVEKLSVRSVSLRDVHGVFHIIPFSSVDMVSNFSRDFAFYVCDMGVAYREDITEVKTAMHDCFDELRQDPEQGLFVLGDLEWFGVNTFGDSAVIVRARVKTLPGKQFGVGRAYNGILKRVFDERGIEIPFPHQTIYFGEAKDGSTQSIKIDSVSDQ